MKSSAKLDQILREFKKLDRDEITMRMSSHLCHMVETYSAAEIAKELAEATALYSLFDTMLERINTIHRVAEWLDLLSQAVEETRRSEKLKVPKAQDIN